jgi:hypothetical protein
MMLERTIEEGLDDFDKVKSAIEQFAQEHRAIIDRYEITLNPGIAVRKGYYIALNSRLGDVSWDRLELSENYQDIPVAVRRSKPK